ncbi:hypothetical protein VSDG_09605 [Cytospora chrysosperma]|uniref:Carrier domain-containing protein n=1 Tax=Cytospora chrysosperma TaxID=252740 RepID=A0A423V9R4_CYTCH|nr:hypothetical protein VSDG_09605 [Valsa sordida]
MHLETIEALVDAYENGHDRRRGVSQHVRKRGRSTHPDLESNITNEPNTNELLLGSPNGTLRKDCNNVDPDLAMLMLTSGSTGNAKAVRITHQQVLASVAGKASMRTLPSDKPFLNWIGMDHVAALTEIHLHALWLGIDQVHISAADIVPSPRNFLNLLSRHRVSYTFAPNFFLAKLISAVKPSDTDAALDLSHLVSLISGGEANDVATCVAISELLGKFGARRNVLTPGFGMTETCAGSIYNLDCPDSDITEKRTVSCLGKCIPGMQMRIVAPTNGAEGPGDLEVRGSVVFEGYYHNQPATQDAFTVDGWFRTGDQGYIDSNGNLCLAGRTKDVINIHGVKIATADIQTAIETALGNRVARLIVFPSRAAHTEQVTIAYVPHIFPMQDNDVAEIAHLATQECLLQTTTHPRVFALREESLPAIPMSTLGKISRSKIARMFEDGKFSPDLDLHDQTMQRVAKSEKLLRSVLRPANKAEACLIDDFAKTLDKTRNTLTMNIDTSLFEAGFTSIHVVKLKYQLEKRLGVSISVIEIMKNPSARTLAAALEAKELKPPSQEEKPLSTYDPVVVLRATGSKTPLWLIHPGVGEVLVFMGLAQHLAVDDRPVYAMRAPGFEPGQKRFINIAQTVDAYTSAIRARQPDGPYALAGYSYGAMLAFEIAKRLEASGDDVGFLGSFNLPPHIKTRMRQLSWNSCLIHLAHFVGLVTEDLLDRVEADPVYRALSRDKAREYVIDAADKPRMEELGLMPNDLERWVDVSFGLQSMATEYDPSGQVKCIDVFHCIPLKVAAKSREQWMTDHLIRWADFTKEPPRFHSVSGAHYTMIGAEHVGDFAKTIRKALKMRGL